MEVIKLVVGPLETNCFLVINEKDKKCIIIDPGFDSDKIIAEIEENSLEPDVILLTHTHFDHIAAVKDLQDKYNIDLYFLEVEEEHYRQQAENFKFYFNNSMELSRDYKFIKQGICKFAGMDFEVITTPGHTIGGVCFYFKECNCVFAGDTIFYRSIGRTDLPTGNFGQLILSIQTKLFNLPDDTVIYTGHGPQTTIGEEKRGNPFLT